VATIRTHSRIERELPAEVRREVDRLLVEGNATYDEIASFLTVKGYDISRSAIGRYGKDFLAQYQRLRIIEDKSRTLISEAGDGLSLEEAASKVFAQKILEALLSGDLDVLEVPRLVSDFAKLQGSTVLRERLKMDVKKRVEKAVETVEKTLTKKAVDAETLRRIREEIYGIAG